MNIALWIIAGVLAVIFGAAGVMKMTQPRKKLAESGLAWTENFGDTPVKLIGLVEVLAAVGLIAPGIFGIATVLVPLAASGLVLVMLGAIATHMRRSEPQLAAMNVVLLLLALFVAWERFGSHAF